MGHRLAITPDAHMSCYSKVLSCRQNEIHPKYGEIASKLGTIKRNRNPHEKRDNEQVLPSKNTIDWDVHRLVNLDEF